MRWRSLHSKRTLPHAGSRFVLLTFKGLGYWNFVGDNPYLDLQKSFFKGLFVPDKKRCILRSIFDINKHADASILK